MVTATKGQAGVADRISGRKLTGGVNFLRATEILIGFIIHELKPVDVFGEAGLSR